MCVCVHDVCVRVCVCVCVYLVVLQQSLCFAQVCISLSCESAANCVQWCSTLLQVDAKREKDAKQGNKFAQVLEGKVNRKVGQRGGLRGEGKAINASSGHVNAAMD